MSLSRHVLIKSWIRLEIRKRVQLTFTNASVHALIADRRLDLSHARTPKTTQFESDQLSRNGVVKGSVRLIKERRLNGYLVGNLKRKYLTALGKRAKLTIV